MAFKQISSPHAHASQNTSQGYAAGSSGPPVPGLIALTIHFGWGSLINVVLSHCHRRHRRSSCVIKLRGRLRRLLPARLQRRTHRRVA